MRNGNNGMSVTDWHQKKPGSYNKLAAAQWKEQQTRDFAVGDQVVIKSLNLSQVRGILNAANWQGVVTSVTPFHIYFCGDSAT